MSYNLGRILRTKPATTATLIGTDKALDSGTALIHRNNLSYLAGELGRRTLASHPGLDTIYHQGSQLGNGSPSLTWIDWDDDDGHSIRLGSFLLTRTGDAAWPTLVLRAQAFAYNGGGGGGVLYVGMWVVPVSPTRPRGAFVDFGDRFAWGSYSTASFGDFSLSLPMYDTDAPATSPAVLSGDGSHASTDDQSVPLREFTVWVGAAAVGATKDTPSQLLGITLGLE